MCIYESVYFKKSLVRNVVIITMDWLFFRVYKHHLQLCHDVQEYEEDPESVTEQIVPKEL